MKQNLQNRLKPEVLDTIQEGINRLKRNNAKQNALGEGDEAPKFALENTEGDMVSSDGLLEQGPLVVSFYRGTW